MMGWVGWMDGRGKKFFRPYCSVLFIVHVGIWHRLSRNCTRPAIIRVPAPYGLRHTYRVPHTWSLLGRDHLRHDAATNLPLNYGEGYDACITARYPFLSAGGRGREARGR